MTGDLEVIGCNVPEYIFFRDFLFRPIVDIISGRRLETTEVLLNGEPLNNDFLYRGRSKSFQTRVIVERFAACDHCIRVWRLGDSDHGTVLRSRQIDVYRLGKYVIWLGKESGVNHSFFVFDKHIWFFDGLTYELLTDEGSWRDLPLLPFFEIRERLDCQIEYEGLDVNCLYLSSSSIDHISNDKILGFSTLSSLVYFIFGPRIPDIEPRSLEEYAIRVREYDRVCDLHVDSAAPTEWREYKVSFDTSNGKACRLLIGRSDFGWSVKLDSVIHFPLWLSGPAIDAIMQYSIDSVDTLPQDFVSLR